MHIEAFPSRYALQSLTELLRVFVPTTTLLVAMVHTRFRMRSHDHGFRDRSVRIQITGHSPSGNFNNLGASSIFHRSLLKLHRWLRLRNQAVANLCDAEEPCSVNTAYDPEASFTTSPRNTTRPVIRNL